MRTEQEQLELLEAMVVANIPFMGLVLEKGESFVNEFCMVAGSNFHRILGPGLTPERVGRKISEFRDKNLPLIASKSTLEFEHSWSKLAKGLNPEEKRDFLKTMPKIVGQNIDRMDKFVMSVVGMCALKIMNPGEARDFLREHNMRP